LEVCTTTFFVEEEGLLALYAQPVEELQAGLDQRQILKSSLLDQVLLSFLVFYIIILCNCLIVVPDKSHHLDEEKPKDKEEDKDKNENKFRSAKEQREMKE
jgi:hypothetical protein